MTYRGYSLPSEWTPLVPGSLTPVASAAEKRLLFLDRHRETIKAHMLTRMEDGDWHGCSDDANDLREVDAEIRGIKLALDKG